MRPYQIVAAERILQRIEISTNYKQLGTLAAGGYVWHTTGSGKTLTSFKAAQLASALPCVERSCSSWTERTSTTRPCASTTASRRARRTRTTRRAVLKKPAGGPERKDHHHDDPEARPFIEQNKGHAIYGGTSC